MGWDLESPGGEEKGGCIGFNRAKTLCKLAVRKTGLAIAGVEQEWGNPVATACSRSASTALWGLMARPGPTPAPAFLHLPIRSYFLKPQARGLLKLELAQSHQHSTRQGPQEDYGLHWHRSWQPPHDEQSAGTQGTGGFKGLLFVKAPPACRGGGCAESPSKGPGPKGSAGFSGDMREVQRTFEVPSALNLKLQTPGETPA